MYNRIGRAHEIEHQIEQGRAQHSFVFSFADLEQLLECLLFNFKVWRISVALCSKGQNHKNLTKQMDNHLF